MGRASERQHHYKGDPVLGSHQPISINGSPGARPEWLILQLPVEEAALQMTSQLQPWLPAVDLAIAAVALEQFRSLGPP